MKKKAYISLSLIAPIALLAGCGQNDIEKQLQPQKEQTQQTQQTEEKPNKNPVKDKEGQKGEATKTQEELIKEKLDVQNKAIEELQNEVDYYRTFIKDFTATFSTEQMNEFIEKEWNYKLMISNINFPKNGVLELSDNSFELILTEDKVPYSVIPDEMSLKGKIEGDFKSLVNISGEVKYETTDDIKEKNSYVKYSFKDIPSRTVIQIKISDALKKELGMNTNELEIKIQ